MTKHPGYSHKVYYISLLASDEFGNELDEYFTFDEASKLDLQGTVVNVLDVHQLIANYRQRHPEKSVEVLDAVNVYEPALDLIESEPKGSYFFDECPFINSFTNWYETDKGKVIKLFRNIVLNDLSLNLHKTMFC